MNIKFILFFLFAFLLLANVIALSPAYEGWVSNNKFLVFEDSTYRVLISTGGGSLLLRSDTETIPLDLNECFEEKYRRFCYNRTIYDSKEKDYQAYLYIYYLQPNIEITRTISDNILSVGDTALFQVVLENTGDEDASGVVFREDFPAKIEITDVSDDVSIENLSVVWEGDIKAGETQEISYKIKSTGEVDKYLKASVNYFNGIENKEIFSESLRLYSAAILATSLSADKEDYEINEEITLTVTLKNNADVPISLDSYNILFPVGIEVKDADEDASRRGENEYYWKGDIDDGKTITLEFTLIPKKIGVFFVVGYGAFDYKGDNYDTENIKAGFITHNEGIEIITSLDSAEYVNSNQYLIVFLKVENKNSFAKIKNIQLETTTEIANFEKTKYGIIGINETIILLNNEIKIPVVESDTNYPISFNVSYMGEDGQRYSLIVEKNIIVSPFKPISIVPLISSYVVYEEEPITIMLGVNNPGLKDLKDVFLKATIPDVFTVKGATSGYVSVDAGQETRSLTFTIIPTRVEKEEVFKINFSASYVEDGKDYSVSEVKEIIVMQKTPKITFTKSLSEDSAYQGEFIDVSYSLTNEDTSSLYDFVLTTSRPQDFDMINMFSYYLPKLNPGESTTFKVEQIRGKKTGIQNTERAYLTYKDKYSREFNTTSGGVSIEIKDAEINGPCVYFEKSLSKAIIRPNEQTTIFFNLTNLGSTKAVGNISDFNKESLISYMESLIFEKNISFDKEGTYYIPKSTFYYHYLNKEVRAYSNELAVLVTNRADIENIAPPVVPTEKNDEELGYEPTIKKKNIILQIYLWIKNLFKRV